MAFNMKVLDRIAMFLKEKFHLNQSEYLIVLPLLLETLMFVFSFFPTNFTFLHVSLTCCVLPR